MDDLEFGLTYASWGLFAFVITFVVTYTGMMH